MIISHSRSHVRSQKVGPAGWRYGYGYGYVRHDTFVTRKPIALYTDHNTGDVARHSALGRSAGVLVAGTGRTAPHRTTKHNTAPHRTDPNQNLTSVLSADRQKSFRGPGPGARAGQYGKHRTSEPASRVLHRVLRRVLHRYLMRPRERGHEGGRDGAARGASGRRLAA